jgi:hypothetical protein
MHRALTATALLLLAGCGDQEEDPASVTVPATDRSPPTAEIALHPPRGGAPLARASQPPEPGRPEPVTLEEPRLRGTAVGRDPDGGVARVRVSIKERITCRHPGGGPTEQRLRTRYYPPPQIERIRSRPGARLPTEVTRTHTLPLAGNRCRPARAVAVHGELWGEATNGSGLEAVTPHLRFAWRADYANP